LLGGTWPADWIGDGRTVERSKPMPARYLRGTFQVAKPPVRARLYLSAFGIVEPRVNGRAVTQDLFVPGWPDYRQRLFYVAYDVTALLQPGENAWGAILGDGWYSGTILPLHQYGPEPMFSAFIDLTDADGKVTTITTGKDWRWAEGPIKMNSIYQGETYDARRERAEWSTPVGCDWTWQPVSVRPGARVYQSYTARLSPPVRRIETIKPVSRREVKPGVFVYDLGQNMVGWVRLKVDAAAGQEITLRHAEMLDADGQIYTTNLRAAAATARYIAKGGGTETWEPSQTFFGFRYVELSGAAQPREDAVEGVVVHTDLPRTGTFECSDPWLNKLYHNTLWGQKGNFLEIPTDCPQRDERLGWTGDTQVFCNTALYTMDAGRFYRQWLFALRDSFRDGPDGGFADTAPNTGHGHGSAGWADAGFIVPWTTWLHTGDRRILEESMPSIQHAIELMADQSPDGIRQSPTAWGDWLSPGFDLFKAPPSYELIATAYFAHSADLAARIADLVGRPELAVRNRALHAKVRAAFQRKYIAADGRIAGDVQTSYLLALGFDLVPPEMRAATVGHLLRTFAEKDNHLSTGFLGTPLITPVLTSLGRADLAYTVLGQKTYPGWLFSVKNGATTIWERWDSWTPEQGFNKDGMNSFNHYAYGSVVEWFYDTIAGLRPVPEAPGWKQFRIVPTPGGGLTSAAATLQTPHGLAASRWTIESGRMRLTVRIPPNTRASVALPAASAAGITLDGAPLGPTKLADGRTEVSLPSGEYTFDLPAPQN
ncbi:MAG: family 78 glycoside hydrolase catalytic domain, partial [Lacunisphaera sp.]|nr:family 78 glycoside hydrolase catalytic domain [Lacunisphaera sp.]